MKMSGKESKHVRGDDPDYPKRVRRSLVDYFQEKAVFRRNLAEEQPWTAGKNDSYADSLDRVSAYVKALPDDDPTLLLLARCPRLYSESADLFTPPDRRLPFTDQAAMHCGPRGRALEPAECAEWFASWASDFVAEANATPTDEEV
jgi:hypothetical protein